MARVAALADGYVLPRSFASLRMTIMERSRRRALARDASRGGRRGWVGGVMAAALARGAAGAGALEAWARAAYHAVGRGFGWACAGLTSRRTTGS